MTERTSTGTEPDSDAPASPPTIGRVAVVTGGTAGVGRATVRELAALGWDVAVLARGAEGLDATAREVRAAGRRVLALPVDVSEWKAVDAAAEQIEAELGPIEAWVNNAFAGSICFFDDLEPDEFERVTAVTYLGCVNGTRAALARMRPRDRGTIIQVGSALAFRGIPLQTAYCGSKHAIHGFTEALRTELLHAGSKVAISEVHLPAVNTPQFDWVLKRGMAHHPQPVPPIYQPEVPAKVIAAMAHAPRRQAIVGAPTFLTIWGNRFLPGLVDRYLARTNVQAQQNPDKDGLETRTNLWEPVPEDRGAHGVFDDTAHSHSPTAFAARHHGLLGWAGAGAVAAAAAVRGVHRIVTRGD